jgi:hypothetical protein
MLITRYTGAGLCARFCPEAGAGCTRDYWWLVQTCLARRTLVVSCDRAGLGWNTEWALDVGAVSANGVAARLAAQALA